MNMCSNIYCAVFLCCVHVFGGGVQHESTKISSPDTDYFLGGRAV